MSFMPQDPLQKIAIAKEKKEVADAAFKKGELQTGSSIFFVDSAGILLEHGVFE
jgi:hypothetical protein